MADIKDTVASHITSNWNAAVLGGSGAVPTADAVGPEDIVKPEDYPEAILVYNDEVGFDRIYNQNTLGDRHTRIYMLLTAHTKTGCTKTHFRAFIDELKSVFGSAISGFDSQVLDPETNVTRSKGVAGGMYQASFVLHLYEYGVSTSSAAAGGAAGASYWAEYFVTTQASANLTNETVLSTKMGAHDFHLVPSADGTYDLGDNTTRYRVLYVDDIQLTNPLADAEVADDVTLTNITQITNRSHTDLSDIGTITHAQLDTLAMYGTGNAAYVPLSTLGASANTEWKVIDGRIINATNTNFTIELVLPVACLKGALKLYLKNLKFAVQDADAAAYVDTVRISGINGNTRTDIDSDTTNHTSAGDKTFSGATFPAAVIDCSTYQSIVVKVTCVVNAANELDMHNFRMECYYAT